MVVVDLAIAEPRVRVEAYVRNLFSRCIRPRTERSTCMTSLPACIIGTALPVVLYTRLSLYDLFLEMLYLSKVLQIWREIYKVGER